MGTVRNVAIAVLFISFVTFVTFFGRLPALRNTPIGALHRVLWVHIPNGFRSVDGRLTGGRLSSSMGSLAHTLWYDRHPTIMIFFIALLSICEILFVPPAWAYFSVWTKCKAIVAIILPYVFLYLAANSDPGYVTPENHVRYMGLYPYDWTIFYPGHVCNTCHLLKPARSKHCSICKHCISKLDHHCIFINNCVGYGNQHWFILLLLSTGTLTAYASYIGASILSGEIGKNMPSWTITGTGISWSQYWRLWAWALQAETRIGGVTMLCTMTTPLVLGFLGYHMYLVWCGTTTNESLKWSDWQEEMSHGSGAVFKRKLLEDRFRDLRVEPAWTTWPVESQQVVLRTASGNPPDGAGSDIGVGEWEQVWKLRDMENLYDVGFWDNLRDTFFPRQDLGSRFAPKSHPSDTSEGSSAEQ